MADWNATQYLRFEKERTQPSIDLINRIEVCNPLNILDVGCGPGNSTAQLAIRYPNAKITGIDSSSDMIGRARSDYPQYEFIHPALLKTLFGLVKPAGVLACQIPMNQDEPSHRNMRLLANSEKWKGRFDAFRVFYNLTPSEYYNLFISMTDDFSLWQTTYYHAMKDHRDIIDWLKGTGLRPYLTKLSAADSADFEHDLLEKYRREYPRQENGDVILRFPRFFFILKKFRM